MPTTPYLLHAQHSTHQYHTARYFPLLQTPFIVTLASFRARVTLRLYIVQRRCQHSDSALATGERQLEPSPIQWYKEYNGYINVSSGASLDQTKVASAFGPDRNSDLPVPRNEYIAWMRSNGVLEQLKNVPNKDPHLSTWRREWPQLWLNECSCQRVRDTSIPADWQSAFSTLMHQMAQKHLRYGQAMKREPTGSVEPQLNVPSRSPRAMSIPGTTIAVFEHRRQTQRPCGTKPLGKSGHTTSAAIDHLPYPPRRQTEGCDEDADFILYSTTTTNTRN